MRLLADSSVNRLVRLSQMWTNTEHEFLLGGRSWLVYAERAWCVAKKESIRIVVNAENEE